MQEYTSLGLIFNTISFGLSVILAVFLFRLWYRQENRLLTDLPLMFGMVFIAQSLNTMMLMLPGTGLVQENFPFFQARSVAILFAAIPLLGSILHIWIPHLKKYHSRVILLLSAYWLSVAFFAVSKEIVILLHTPVLVGLMIVLIITFAITWRTHRLSEVRSDLMVLSILFTIVGQTFRVPLLTLGLDYVAYSVNALSVVIATLALSNPWYRHESSDIVVTQTQESLSSSI